MMRNNYQNCKLIQFREDNDVHILEISKIQRNYAGKYQCRAMNTDGEAHCSANVVILPTIYPQSPSKPLSTMGSPPRFLRTFTDRKTTLGSTVRFDARVSGSQPLNVRLFI